jgi:hypothetical protein
MGETAVQYQIQISRTGAGATEAVNEFKAVEAAAAKTNATLSTGTNATATLSATTKTATSSLKAMQGTLTLIGLQSFPQLTLAATTAQSAISGIKTAAAAAGVSIAAMGAQLAVITLGAYAAAKAVQEFLNMNTATGQMTASSAANDAQVSEASAKLHSRIMEEVQSGKLSFSDSEAESIERLLTSNPSNEKYKQAVKLYQSKQPSSDFMSESEKSAVLRNRMGAMEQGFAFDDAVRNTSTRNAGQINTEADRAAEIERVQERALARKTEYNRLGQEGIINEEQLRDLLRESDIERMNSLGEIKNALTEVQQLARSATESFASGFASAFVDFASGTKSAKEAFTDFARSFLSQMAQMIMQQLILNAIKNSSFGGMLGFAEGGVKFAANGLAGVSSVSSPTYFPKFNVVAGEAGSEMMTVLARPRMMEVGGMQAVVGSAQGQQLAITSASDLAGRGGAGGTIVIQVQGTPDFEARVISSSVKGAVVQVATDMRQDTPISRGVKGLTA